MRLVLPKKLLLSSGKQGSGSMDKEAWEKGTQKNKKGVMEKI